MQPIQEYLQSLTLPNNAGPGTQQITINVNNDGAILGYDASGNLEFSIASAGGTDQYGNTYVQGFAVYDRTDNIFVFLNDGAIGFGQMVNGLPVETGAGFIEAQNSFPGQLFFNSGVLATGATDAAAFLMVCGEPGLNTGNGNNPFVVLSDIVGTSQVDFQMTGNMQKVKVTGSGAVTKVNPTLGTGWGTASLRSATPIQYSQDCCDHVTIAGSFEATSTTPSSSLFTLTGVPNHTNFNGLMLHETAAGGMVGISTIFVAGTSVSVFSLGTVTVGDIYSVHPMVIPMNNLP